jgi:hypothetical protein
MTIIAGIMPNLFPKIRRQLYTWEREISEPIDRVWILNLHPMTSTQGYKVPGFHLCRRPSQTQSSQDISWGLLGDGITSHLFFLHSPIFFPSFQWCWFPDHFSLILSPFPRLTSLQHWESPGKRRGVNGSFQLPSQPFFLLWALLYRLHHPSPYAHWFLKGDYQETEVEEKSITIFVTQVPLCSGYRLDHGCNRLLKNLSPDGDPLQCWKM